MVFETKLCIVGKLFLFAGESDGFFAPRDTGIDHMANQLRRNALPAKVGMHADTEDRLNGIIPIVQGDIRKHLVFDVAFIDHRAHDVPHDAAVAFKDKKAFGIGSDPVSDGIKACGFFLGESQRFHHVARLQIFHFHLSDDVCHRLFPHAVDSASSIAVLHTLYNRANY